VVDVSFTNAPRFNVAEFTFHDRLRLDGDRLHGELRMVVDGIEYELRCDWQIVDGALKGTCVDPFAGAPVDGLVVGSARAAAAREGGARNGTARIVLRREWNGGSNRHAEGGMDFVLEDGEITDLRLSPFIGRPDSWSAEIHGHTLELRDGRLTGTIDVTVTTGPAGNYMPEGRYELRFDNQVVHNLVRGSFTAARHGDRPTTHTIPFGRIDVNSGDPVDPANAVYVIRLERALLGNGEPKTMELHLTAREGRFVEPGIARGLGFNRGDFPVDASDLRVTDDGRLTGELELDVVSDGWVPRADLPSSYSVDARVDGPAVDGTHAGTFGIREPKRVEVTGAIAGD